MARIAKEHIDLNYFFNKFNRDCRNPYHRYRSFDICYNYFLNNRGHLVGRNLEKSCVYLAAYLASWGMYRGSTEILQKNAMCLKDVIFYISKNDDNFRNVDLDQYENEGGQQKVLKGYDGLNKELITRKFEKPTETLITKIMLGVWSCVPAFDEYFNIGMQEYCGKGFLTVETEKKLNKITEFCRNGDNLKRLAKVNLKKAKVLDMVFHQAGRMLCSSEYFEKEFTNGNSSQNLVEALKNNRGIKFKESILAGSTHIDNLNKILKYKKLYQKFDDILVDTDRQLIDRIEKGLLSTKKIQMFNRTLIDRGEPNISPQNPVDFKGDFLLGYERN